MIICEFPEKLFQEYSNFFLFIFFFFNFKHDLKKNIFAADHNQVFCQKASPKLNIVLYVVLPWPFGLEQSVVSVLILHLVYFVFGQK